LRGGKKTITRNGKELWVAVRGKDGIAIPDAEAAVKESEGVRADAVRQYLPTINGPTQVWFSADGSFAFMEGYSEVCFGTA